MAFALRDYQEDIIQRTRLALRSHNSVLIESPTGSGKTALAGHMVGTASSKGKRAYFICHRQELIEQTSITFEKVGIPHGFIANGYRPDPYLKVQICSIDTLKNRLEKVLPPDLCVWDECHHTAAAGWSRVKNYYGRAKSVGLTATPQRLDGKGLYKWFDEIIHGPAVSWLIEQGYLSDYRVFAPSTPDLSGVHTRMGDYKKDELAALMDNTITGDAIKHYRKLADGKSAVAFCVSINHSQQVAARFQEAGIVAQHIDGKTPRQERKKLIQAFRDGHIKVLTNVDIVSEGFDLPGIEASILLRPTQSLSLYLQQVGRSLRPDEGKQAAIILDHANNVARHGLPDDVREWSLADREKKKQSDSEPGETIKQCPDCYAVHRPMPKCPNCGHEYVNEGREVEEVEGDLIELDREAVRRRQKQEQGQCKTLESLVELGRSRNYKDPHKWAAYVWTARQAKRRAA